ncbi:hypothetical protein IMG5_052130 [Ichthyophthirius multifiliis]|uniref:Transmembrane protein n=1 Tax=Ichthyophthirius multifiliis TaxID=5932 RepID=G0QMV3_ICHMU|nr:hypothetical protein IMG5_052130 [Ichthyophthirius multifiliis]EGR33451.1 hypothetical protein IMG5_052130 [Ichthyophthirius multifiliis]|eukprot:XP_004037437.1 hypothetical protein IMG5_052130 [Ichthyophthirius multifiliis]
MNNNLSEQNFHDIPFFAQNNNQQQFSQLNQENSQIKFTNQQNLQQSPFSYNKNNQQQTNNNNNLQEESNKISKHLLNMIKNTENIYSKYFQADENEINENIQRKQVLPKPQILNKFNLNSPKSVSIQKKKNFQQQMQIEKENNQRKIVNQIAFFYQKLKEDKNQQIEQQLNNQEKLEKKNIEVKKKEVLIQKTTDFELKNNYSFDFFFQISVNEIDIFKKQLDRNHLQQLFFEQLSFYELPIQRNYSKKDDFVKIVEKNQNFQIIKHLCIYNMLSKIKKIIEIRQKFKELKKDLVILQKKSTFLKKNKDKILILKDLKMRLIQKGFFEYLKNKVFYKKQVQSYLDQIIYQRKKHQIFMCFFWMKTYKNIRQDKICINKELQLFFLKKYFLGLKKQCFFKKGNFYRPFFQEIRKKRMFFILKEFWNKFLVFFQFQKMKVKQKNISGLIFVQKLKMKSFAILKALKNKEKKQFIYTKNIACRYQRELYEINVQIKQMFFFKKINENLNEDDEFESEKALRKARQEMLLQKLNNQAAISQDNQSTYKEKYQQSQYIIENCQKIQEKQKIIKNIQIFQFYQHIQSLIQKLKKNCLYKEESKNLVVLKVKKRDILQKIKEKEIFVKKKSSFLHWRGLFLEKELNVKLELLIQMKNALKILNFFQQKYSFCKIQKEKIEKKKENFLIQKSFFYLKKISWPKIQLENQKILFFKKKFFFQKFVFFKAFQKVKKMSTLFYLQNLKKKSLKNLQVQCLLQKKLRTTYQKSLKQRLLRKWLQRLNQKHFLRNFFSRILLSTEELIIFKYKNKQNFIQKVFQAWKQILQENENTKIQKIQNFSAKIHYNSVLKTHFFFIWKKQICQEKSLKKLFFQILPKQLNLCIIQPWKKITFQHTGKIISHQNQKNRDLKINAFFGLKNNYKIKRKSVNFFKKKFFEKIKEFQQKSIQNRQKIYKNFILVKYFKKLMINLLKKMKKKKNLERIQLFLVQKSLKKSFFYLKNYVQIKNSEKLLNIKLRKYYEKKLKKIIFVSLKVYELNQKKKKIKFEKSDEFRDLSQKKKINKYQLNIDENMRYQIIQIFKQWRILSIKNKDIKFILSKIQQQKSRDLLKKIMFLWKQETPFIQNQKIQQTINIQNYQQKQQESNKQYQQQQKQQFNLYQQKQQYEQQQNLKQSINEKQNKKKKVLNLILKIKINQIKLKIKIFKQIRIWNKFIRIIYCFMKIQSKKNQQYNLQKCFDIFYFIYRYYFIYLLYLFFLKQKKNKIEFLQKKINFYKYILLYQILKILFFFHQSYIKSFCISYH